MADHHGQRAQELIAARKAEDSFSTMDRVLSHLKRKTTDTKQPYLVRRAKKKPSLNLFIQVKTFNNINLNQPRVTKIINKILSRIN